MFVWVRAYTAGRDQQSRSGVFLSCFLPCFLRQDVSVNLEVRSCLHFEARNTTHATPCPAPYKTAWSPDSAPHVCTALLWNHLPSLLPFVCYKMWLPYTPQVSKTLRLLIWCVLCAVATLFQVLQPFLPSYVFTGCTELTVLGPKSGPVFIFLWIKFYWTSCSFFSHIVSGCFCAVMEEFNSYWALQLCDPQRLKLTRKTT